MSSNTYWNQQGQLVSQHYDDIYFSSDDGLEETRHVFLKHNNLQERFASLTSTHFTIAETGFGTGLNFLATCQLWLSEAPKHSHLHFISIEKFPLAIDTLDKALQPWEELGHLRKQLIQHYPVLTPGFHRICFSNSISLTLIIGDVADGLSQLISNPYQNDALEARQWQGVDAWFLDGFAPAKNPDMWTEQLFTIISKLSKKNTTLATFTAAGLVKRGLTSAGFDVEKVSGYGSKREMITACYKPDNAQDILSISHIPKKEKSAPWALIKNYSAISTENSIAIIGGGLAGCHTAKALANKGYRVTIFEKNKIASGASGNAQGLVYAKLTANSEPQGAFNLFSLAYAQHIYASYWQNATPEQGEQCGILQLATTKNIQETQEKIAAFFSENSQLIRHISAEEASQLAGTRIDFSALYFPQSGWIAPTELCRWLINSENISIVENTPIDAIEYLNKKWQLLTSNGEKHTFQSVIISSAYDATHLLPTANLPIKKIRGQVSHYQPKEQTSSLKMAVCGEGYIAPSQTFHCLGASFNLGDNSSEISLNDHIDNLSKITKQVPEIISNTALEAESLKNMDGRVSFRCTTPDYLPIVGGIPDNQALQTHFASLANNAHAIPNISGDYLPNLYINIGHGSRGLTYTPLCAEILASLISGSPPPLAQNLIQRLSPARFTIRELIRKR